MAKLTAEQALDGLKKLHAAIKEPRVITREELRRASGLRYTDMLTLAQQGLIKCTRGRRKTEWVWATEVIPNMHMAKRMLDTRLEFPGSGPALAEKTEPAANGEASVAYISGGVRVFKKFEVTKKYGDEEFIITLENTRSGWQHDCTGTEIMLETVNVDKLKAIGFALVTAADILEGNIKG